MNAARVCSSSGCRLQGAPFTPAEALASFWLRGGGASKYSLSGQMNYIGGGEGGGEGTSPSVLFRLRVCACA